jgi:hypothetical protein
MHPIHLRGAVGALLVSLAIVGCGGTPATTAPSATIAPTPVATDTAPTAPPATSEPTATSGSGLATTGRIEVPDHGFALTLPDGWTRLDLSAGDLEELMSAGLGEIDPALAAQYSAQIRTMIAAGLAVFALGPDAASGTNLTILAIPSMGLSLDLLEQLNAGQIEQLAGGEVTTERVTLPAGEAIHFTYGVPVPTLGTESTIDQYLLIAGDKQLVITVTGAAAEDGTAIANSIELID